jgi:hypothetical protein
MTSAMDHLCAVSVSQRMPDPKDASSQGGMMLLQDTLQAKGSSAHRDWFSFSRWQSSKKGRERSQVLTQRDSHIPISSCLPMHSWACPARAAAITGQRHLPRMTARSCLSPYVPCFVELQNGELSEPYVEGRASRSFRLPRNTLAARTFVQHIDERDHFLASPSILQLRSGRILVLFEKCALRTLLHMCLTSAWHGAALRWWAASFVM